MDQEHRVKQINKKNTVYVICDLRYLLFSRIQTIKTQNYKTYYDKKNYKYNTYKCKVMVKLTNLPLLGSTVLPEGLCFLSTRDKALTILKKKNVACDLLSDNSFYHWIHFLYISTIDLNQVIDCH